MEENKVERVEPYFFCNRGKRNHLNSQYNISDIDTWYRPMRHTKHCEDYIKIDSVIQDNSEPTNGSEPMNEELDKEIEKYFSKSFYDDRDKTIISMCAVHFAKWQKEKDNKELQIAEEHGILSGMNMQKEQLMKDAVDVSFIQDYKYKTPILTGDIKNKFGLTTGQHVKLIIIKDND